MNSKTTGIWFVMALALAAFIFVSEHYLRPAAAGPVELLPHWKLSDITEVQVIPAGALEIRAARTNGGWQLTRPVRYPAQAAAIETLLDTLQKLAPDKITASELRAYKNPETEFGFDNPPVSLVVQAGGQSWQLKVGNRTAPGDQVYLRVVGEDGAFVADAGWLKYLPRTANDWRGTALADATAANDWILLTNAVKGVVMEFRRDATNQLWRMTRPLSARANSERIADALQRLRDARVTQFVTDDPKADLSVFGLQPADLDLWLGRGTNFTAALHAGKSLTNDTTQMFVRREGWDAVMAAARETLSPWRGSVIDFRDPHLLELTVPVAEIEVTGPANTAGFDLQRRGSNDWSLAGEKFPVDAENTEQFLKLLAGLKIADFVKEGVTAPDLQAYGLAAPARQIILRSAVGDSNAVIAQIQFGATQTNEIFVRRADEDFVYGLALADLGRLPESGWEFRDRQIWNFSETNVAQITLRQNGKVRQMVRTGANQWSPAPGSQGAAGIVNNPPAIEETVHRLGELAALGWVGRNITEPEKYGLNTNNLQITIELKNGVKNTVDFGGEIASAQTALAAVTLDGERWAFVFPPVLYQFVLSYLAIPANVP